VVSIGVKLYRKRGHLKSFLLSNIDMPQSVYTLVVLLFLSSSADRTIISMAIHQALPDRQVLINNFI
jgi:hypothetical protein